jgi:transcriptional regulator with XRE-family HTH domain
MDMNIEDARRRELGAFLRAHRERLDPAAVGLPPTPRRRTPGLRREEVAARSGLGLAWYTWLEQGRVAASRQVLESLARALLLDDDARRHALNLAGLYSPPNDDQRDQVAQRLQPVLDAWPTSAALLVDRRFDIVAWNEAYTALWTDPASLEPARRNLMWLMVADPMLRTLLGRWEDVAKDVLAQFRSQAQHHPTDARTREVFEILEADVPELRHWWHCRSVREFAARTVSVDHPVAGPLNLVFSTMRPVDAPSWTIMLQTPATPADHAQVAAAAAVRSAASLAAPAEVTRPRPTRSARPAGRTRTPRLVGDHVG